jgi:hypothetical protein
VRRWENTKILPLVSNANLPQSSTQKNWRCSRSFDCFLQTFVLQHAIRVNPCLFLINNQHRECTQRQSASYHPPAFSVC